MEEAQTSAGSRKIIGHDEGGRRLGPLGRPARFWLRTKQRVQTQHSVLGMLNAGGLLSI